MEREFGKEATEEVTEMAQRINEMSEHIGARRLYTVMEKLLEDISFSAPDMQKRTIAITKDYVREKLGEFLEKEDLSRYIL